ncbi:MerR family transcriptional regulator [Pseudonocardia eucalypti]|uniref:MerR family transcriptional regulator n=1 Tax=Pseudonocardia eucalypti TaxID=648755 RepID=A0ABP9RDC7_9PSEU|nr:DNA-binding transcriptional MerR regulator [Pseudonocardia eucalypti]
MTAPQWSRGRGAEEGRWSIGAVLDRLRGEFPDVTISKIRFLESEGLVSPARSASGYRQFSGEDLERLRFVLAAQRDHYLPLKVIKQQLDERDQEASGEARPLVAVPSGAPDASVAPSKVRLTREDLLSEAGIDVATLAALEQYGIVRPGPAGFYDTDAVELARTASALTEFGIEPRHLRAFRAAADRETGLLQQVVGPVARQRDPDAAARAEDLLREMAGLSVRLHALLIRVGLREGLPR